MTAFRKSYKERLNDALSDSVAETTLFKSDVGYKSLISTKKSLVDNNYAKSQADVSYGYILNCKKTKKLKKDVLVVNISNSEKEQNFINSNNALKNENVTSYKSQDVDIKKEICIDYCIEDSTYDAECAFKEEFYDSSVKAEGRIKCDDNDDHEGYKSSSNFIDKMFKQMEPLANSLVECRLCYKKIKETSKKQHCNTHMGLKPFPCCYCGARFTRKGDALRHRKTIHRNIKPFQCVICYKSFAERKVLIAHLQNHDRGVYYSCVTCGYKFGKREYFQSHIQFIHPSTKEQSITIMKDAIKKGKKQLEKLLLEENFKGNQLSLDMYDDDGIISEPQVNQNNEKARFKKKENLPCDFKIEECLSLESKFSHLKSREVESCNKKYKHAKNKQFKGSEDGDIKIGTLSFTHTILPQNEEETNSYEDEELVNKAISSAISQSKCVLEKMFCDGSNLSSIYQRTKTLATESNENSSITETSKNKHSEIHITANFGGSLRKFIIHLPDTKIDPLCKDGIESLVNIVNYVCSDRDDIIGPVEIEVHQLS